jgi:hypothetical protein
MIATGSSTAARYNGLGCFIGCLPQARKLIVELFSRENYLIEAILKE